MTKRKPAPAPPKPQSYCAAVQHSQAAGIDPLHRDYHDREYGFPLRGDAELFERLMLEINQAGLSWLTILRKQAGFRRAYAGFDVDRVARFGVREKRRLLADAGIIRNRLKVDAAIENARRLRALRSEFGGFAAWLDAHHPLHLDDWSALFKRTFVFTGGEIVREFLVSTGYLPGAHEAGCPIYARVLRRRPAWSREAS
jgi:DNA-3-methyladenine glycosylase I